MQKRGKDKIHSAGGFGLLAVVAGGAIITCVALAGWQSVFSRSDVLQPADSLVKEIPSQSPSSDTNVQTTAEPLSSGNPGVEQTQQVRQELAAMDSASSEKNGKWFGLCKKRSIASIADFRRTVEADPALAVYYSGFNWEEAKVGRLKKDVMAYVAHRKGDVIQQTSQPISLPKGDEYITDGVRTARTYCCNDIAMSPSAGNEKTLIGIAPSAGIPEKKSVSSSPSALAPSAENDADPVLKPVPLAAPFFLGGDEPVNLPSLSHKIPGQILDPDPADTTPVPVPGTLLIMSSGLLALAGLARKRHHDPS